MEEFEYELMEFDVKELEEYLYVQLAKRGFAPGKMEVETIAEILFDFLLDEDE